MSEKDIKSKSDGHWPGERKNKKKREKPRKGTEQTGIIMQLCGARAPHFFFQSDNKLAVVRSFLFRLFLQAKLGKPFLFMSNL